MFALSDGALAPADPNAVVQGETYRFTVLTDRLIRMEWNERGEFIDEASQLVVSREAARQTKDFARADALRAEIEALGYRVEDAADGARLFPRR